MYELARGPLVWIAFLVFVGGSLYKLYSMAVMARGERTVFPTMSLKFGLRSIFHWMVPFNSRNMRMHPVMTLVTFAFHICLLLTPLFAMGHVESWRESWGISWWSLPAGVADVMTLVVICGGAFLALRRLAAPEVRNVTTLSDWVLLAIVVAPFLTGFLAHRQVFSYPTMVTLHIISGALWLMVIPFTRLFHMFWFAFARAYMGSESGAVRNARDW